jgi:HSP20 family protein
MQGGNVMSEKTDLPATTGEAQSKRWDPMQMIADLQTELDRFWEGRTPMMSLRRLADMPTKWTPKIDVFGQNGSIIVKAEVPGVPKESMDVYVEDGDLVIRGERKAEKEVKETDFYRMERSYGSFYRRLPLPEGVDPKAIEANYADGVLEVKVPKPAMPEPKPTKIAIT